MKIGSLFNFCIIAGVLVSTSVVHAQTTQGNPGVDYPNYHSIPKTSFSCSEQKYIPGFYADLETNCQAFHFCFKDGQESFLCPMGTIYNQKILACDSWYNSNCSLAPLSYSVNAGPAMENAGRNIPTLLKLRGRSQGTSTPNIFEKLSSLYGANADLTPPEGSEPASFSGDSNEMPNSNVSSDISNEVSSAGNETSEMNNEQFSENTPFGVDETLQGDINIDDETDELDYESMIEEQNGEMGTNVVYDPISNGYYMRYDPHQAEWQQESDPTSDEFRRFYDYEQFQDQYNVMLQNSGDSSEELLAEPEDMDLNDVGRDYTDFSKRQLNVEHLSNRYRRRPMYVVVEDDEPEDEYPSEVEDDYLVGEPGLDSSMEDSNSVEEIPVGSDETLEGGEAFEQESGPEVSEEVYKRLQFPFRREYSNERPLASEEFGNLINELEFPEKDFFDESQSDRETATSIPSEHEQIYNEESSEGVLADLQSDPFANVGQDPTADDYLSDSPTFGVGEMSASDQESYQDSGVDSWYQTVDESGITAGDTDDTFVVIPDESDDFSDSSSDYVNVDNAVDGDSANEYTYEQPEDYMADEGYGAYQDAYEYYKSHREFPDGYEAVESGSFQGPDYDYSRHYGRQYIPREMYEEYEDVDYPNYFPEEANEESYYIRQQYQPMSYMDPTYGAESGYFRDDFSQNPYIEGGENSEYYASDEASEYYSQPDTQWVQEDLNEDFEMENQLGVTEVPLPLDATDADFVNLDENLSNSVGSEEQEGNEVLNDFASEDESSDQETYYVFDFDEEEKINEDESEFNEDAEVLESDVKQTIETDNNLHASDESTLNGSTFHKDASEMSSETDRAEDIGLHSFLTGQNGNANSPDLPSNSGASFNMKPLTDTWSPFATESSLLDKPVTLSSALERLAALNAVKSPRASDIGNLDFSSDSLYLNSMAFPGSSMDFGPYGYGAGLGQQYGMLDSLQPNKVTEGFSQRTGDNEEVKIPKLSSLQERLRSMKRGKFGMFKKYMSSMNNQKP